MTEESKPLSDRQLQVLALVAKGMTDGEIAVELGLSAHTIACYMKRIRVRLNARSRAHAVALAMREGILIAQSPVDRNS